MTVVAPPTIVTALLRRVLREEYKWTTEMWQDLLRALARAAP